MTTELHGWATELDTLLSQVWARLMRGVGNSHARATSGLCHGTTRRNARGAHRGVAGCRSAGSHLGHAYRSAVGQGCGAAPEPFGRTACLGRNRAFADADYRFGRGAFCRGRFRDVAAGTDSFTTNSPCQRVVMRGP